MSEITGMTYLQRVLESQSLEPGQTAAGFLLFAYPSGHQELARSAETAGNNIFVGQFPHADIKISVFDGVGHSIENIDADRDPGISEPYPKHYKFSLSQAINKPVSFDTFYNSCSGR